MGRLPVLPTNIGLRLDMDKNFSLIRKFVHHTVISAYHIHTERHTDRHTDRKTDRQTDKLTDR
jgi:hypothetical protein